MSQQIADFYAKFTTDTSGLVTGANDAKLALGGVASSAGGVDTSLAGLARSFLGPLAGMLTFTGAVSAVIAALNDCTDAAAVSELSGRRFEVAWASTGRAADISAPQIEALAERMMRLSSLDDEAILDSFAAVSKFESIDTSSMEDVVRAAADMSAALGGDLAANAEAIGRALETGVIPKSWGFSAALRDNIQAAIEAGDKTGALSLVLDELTRRYGGQSLAALTTYTGATDALKTSIESVAETVGGSYIGALTLAKLILADSVDFVNDLATANQTGEQAAALHAMSTQELNDALAVANVALSEAEGKTQAASIATGIMAIKTELASRATDGLTFSTAGLNAGALLATQALEDATVAVIDYGDKLTAVSGYAQDYTTYTNNLTTAQNNVTTATQDYFNFVAANPYDTEGIERMKARVNDAQTAVEDLEAANKRQTDMWILNILTQQLSIGGLTEAEMNFLLQYQVDTGLISADAAIRASELYDSAMTMAAGFSTAGGAVWGIKAGIDALYDKTVSITIITENQNVGPITPPPSNPQPPDSYVPPESNAEGGFFVGWSMVGDSAGGGITPYTEYVYAPGGATVYTRSQMLGLVDTGISPEMKPSEPFQLAPSSPKQDTGWGSALPKVVVLDPQSVRDLADALFSQLARVL